VIRAEGEDQTALDSIKGELERFMNAQGVNHIPWEG
jgi:hypothetical protein